MRVTVEYISPGELTDEERRSLRVRGTGAMAANADDRGVIPLPPDADTGYSHCIFYRALDAEGHVIDTGRTRFRGPNETDELGATVMDEIGEPVALPPDADALDRAKTNIAGQYERQ